MEPRRQRGGLSLVDAERAYEGPEIASAGELRQQIRSHEVGRRDAGAVCRRAPSGGVQSKERRPERRYAYSAEWEDGEYEWGDQDGEGDGEVAAGMTDTDDEFSELQEEAQSGVEKRKNSWLC